MDWLDWLVQWTYEFVQEVGVIPTLFICFLLFVALMGLVWISVITERGGNRW